MQDACEEILLGVHHVLRKKRGLTKHVLRHRALISVSNAEEAYKLKQFADGLAQPLMLPQGPGTTFSRADLRIPIHSLLLALLDGC